MTRTQFMLLMVVIAASIVFGMVVGGRLNAPPVALAAPNVESWSSLTPANAVPTVVVDFADVVERAMPAVVSVTSTSTAQENENSNDGGNNPFRWFFGEPQEDPRGPQRPDVGEGSGFIVSNDGYVLTNNHVVEDADRVTVGLNDGKTYDAEVVGTDPSIDLALLKLDSDGDDFPTLPIGDSGELRVGQWVIAIGNPLDYEHTVTVGVISAKQRRVPLRGTDVGVANFLQTDAAINLGNSGGPLLDTGGNVIGINTAITRANFAEGIGFALPIDQARRAMEQLRATGSVKRGFIGITMNPNAIDEEARDYYKLPDTNGVLVQRVEPDGPADAAGVRGGDVIRKVDGGEVRSNADLIGKISSHMPGEKVELQIFRKGKTIDVTAVLGDRDEGLRTQAGTRPTPESRQQREARPALGIRVEPLEPYRGPMGLDEDVNGVIVSEVDLNSQANDKGIQARMIITAIDDQEIGSVEEWNNIVSDLRPGSTVKIELLVGSQGRLIFLRVPKE